MDDHLLEVLNDKIILENFNSGKPLLPLLPTPYAGNRRCIPLGFECICAGDPSDETSRANEALHEHGFPSSLVDFWLKLEGENGLRC